MMKLFLLNSSKCYRRWLTCAAVLVGFVTSAHADVWGYIDPNGQVHFAASRLDDRYELFFHSTPGFDAQQAAFGMLPKRQAEPVDPLPSTPSSAMGYESPSSAIAAKASRLNSILEKSPSFSRAKMALQTAAAENGIEPELLKALIATESGFNAYAVSPKGAVGLMQLMPGTAERYGVHGDAVISLADKLTDPAVNIRAGARYLHDLLRMFPGHPELAVASYNAGEGAVKKYGNQIPPYPETQNYVKTVLQLYRVLKPEQATYMASRSVFKSLPPPVDTATTPTAPKGFMLATYNRGNLPASIGSAPSLPLGVINPSPLAATPTGKSMSATPQKLSREQAQAFNKKVDSVSGSGQASGNSPVSNVQLEKLIAPRPEFDAVTDMVQPMAQPNAADSSTVQPSASLQGGKSKTAKVNKPQVQPTVAPTSVESNAHPNFVNNAPNTSMGPIRTGYGIKVQAIAAVPTYDVAPKLADSNSAPLQAARVDDAQSGQPIAVPSVRRPISIGLPKDARPYIPSVSAQPISATPAETKVANFAN